MKSHCFIKRLLFLAVAVLLCGALFSCFGDDESSDSGECRIYLEDNYSRMVDLYAVPSPQGEQGNWGSSIINNYTILQGYGWKKYTFAPGTYDIKLTYYGSGYVFKTFTDYTMQGDDGEGVKYEVDSDGDLFITTFTFD